MITRRTLATLAAIPFLLAACGGDGDGGGNEPAQNDDGGAEAEDPYEVYLEIAPEDAPELSREDAQARALLGCEEDWAPGTVDAALAEAYADLCD